MFFVTDFMANGAVEQFLDDTAAFQATGDADSDFNLSDTECIRRVGLQTARALGHLHRHGIVHRDVASRNLLLDDRGTVQLCDFGLARFLLLEGDDPNPRYNMRDESQPLPVRWMAPESLRHGYFSAKSDVWMLGVTLWEVLTCSMPYQGSSNSEAIAKIVSGVVLECPRHTPQWLQDAINACTRTDPDERPDMLQLEALLLLEQLSDVQLWEAVEGRQRGAPDMEGHKELGRKELSGVREGSEEGESGVRTPASGSDRASSVRESGED
jgi:serine/threonine protein kinase